MRTPARAKPATQEDLQTCAHGAQKWRRKTLRQIAAWIRQAAGAVAGPSPAASPGRYGRELFPNLFVMPLESRRVLSVSPLPYDPLQPPAVDAGGSANDGSADTFYLVRQGDEVQVSVNGSEVFTGDVTELDTLAINGSGDADTLVVDFSGGNPIPAGGLSFDGGGGNDVLTVIGSGLDATYSPDASISGSGVLTFGDRAISFSGLEPIDYDVTGGTFTLDLPGGDDVVHVANGTLTDAVTPALAISGTSGGVAFEEARVTGSAIVIDTTTVSGNDQITIDSADNAHGNTSLHVVTGSEAGDVVTVDGTASFSGLVTIDTVRVDLNADVTGPLAGSAETVNVASPGQIQDGIDVAADGATIDVAAGTYNENLVISKSNLTVQSAGGAAATIVNLNDTTAGGVFISGDGNTLDGFTLRDYTDDGYESKIVRVAIGADGNTISHNVIQGNLGQPGVADPTDYGVLCYGSNNTLEANEIFDVGYIGVNVVGSPHSGASDNLIAGNNIHDVGIYAIAIDRSPGNVITQNTISDVVGGTLWGYYYDPAVWCWGIIIWGEAADGNRIVDQDVIGLPNGIILSSAHNTTVENCTISDNGNVGLQISKSSWAGGVPEGNVVTNSFIDNNTIGVRIVGGPGDIGPGNELQGNSLSGNATAALSNESDVTIDAGGNWWGSSDESAVRAAILGDVDFTPYLATGTDVGGDPTDGFQGDFSQLAVTLEGEQTGPLGRIQEAVDRVEGNGTVFVNPGTYYETVVVNRPGLPSLTLRGTTGTPGDVVIDPAGADGITIDSTDNVTVRDLRVTGGASGIVAAGAANLMLLDVESTGNSADGFYGSALSGTTSVSGGTFSGNGGLGLRVEGSDDIVVSGATVSGNGSGFLVADATSLAITGLTLTGNGSESVIDDVATVTFTTSAGAEEDTIDINSPDVGASRFRHTRDGIAQDVIRFANVSQLSFDTGAGRDTVNVAPNALGGAVITLDGGDPAGTPGDTLNYLSDGVNAFLYGSATITTAGHENIEHANSEHAVVTGDLILAGTSGDDTLTVTATGPDSGTYVLTTDGVDGPTVSFSGISKLTFDGGDGSDRLVIQHPAGGLFQPTDGIAFDGGEAPGDSDDLVVSGGSTSAVRHTLTGEGTGSIDFDNDGQDDLTYQGLEPITDTMAADQRIFAFAGAGETIVLSDDADVNDGQSRIDSTLGESIVFSNPGDSLIVETGGGSGADAIEVRGLDAAFAADLVINGDADDTVAFTVAPLDIGGDLRVNAASITVEQDVAAQSIDFNAPLLIAANVGLTAATDVDFRGDVLLAGSMTCAATNVTFHGTVDDDGNGGTPSQLSVTADGITRFEGEVGGTPIDGLITDGGGVTQLGGDVTASLGPIRFDGAVELDADVTIESAGPAGIVFAKTVDSDSVGPRDLHVVTTNPAATIEFQAAVGGIRPLDRLTITNSGGVTIGDAADISLDGRFLQDGGGPVAIGGTITTTGDDITFTSAVTLTDDVTLATGSGGGDIRFPATAPIDSEAGQNHGLTLDVGEGNILLAASVGALQPLGELRITEAADVTVDAAIHVESFFQGAGSGTTRLLAPVTADSSSVGIDVHNNVVLIETAVATAGGSTTFMADDDMQLNGPASLASNGGDVTLQADADGDQNGSGGGLVMAESTAIHAGGGTVNLSADEDVVLAIVETTGDLSVTSTSGAISDTPQADLSVGGLAAFDAAETVTLGDSGATDSTNFGSLFLRGTVVAVHEDSATSLAGVEADRLVLVSAGAITDDGSIQVSGTASLTASDGVDRFDITLGGEPGETTNFGSLELFAANVSIQEDSATLLTAVDAATLRLTSTGAITDDGNVEVAGQTVLDAGSAEIVLGDDPLYTANFGTLRLCGGDVAITESSSTVLVGADVGSLAVISPADIDTQDDVVRASGAIVLQAAGNVTVHAIPGQPLAESEVVGSQVSIDAGGLITIENEAALESAYGRVTNAPPLLRIGELDPDKTIVPGDRVQELSGTIGGIEAEGDNLELGQDFIVLVTWDDGQTTVIDMSNLPGGVPLTAGDRLEVHVGEDTSDYTVTVVPGDGTGPVEVLITREYPVSHLITVSLEVVATVVVTNDPDIVLTDSRAIDLNRVGDSVATSVAGDEFHMVAIPMEFEKPSAIITETKPVATPEVRTTPPLQTTRLEESRPPSGAVVQETRKLYLVKVSPDGTEGEKHELPPDALLDLTGLFEKFRTKKLPNGLYRIYLDEPGFPVRKLIEFYKSGDTFGEPVREPGRGSNPRVDDGASLDTPPVDRTADASLPGGSAETQRQWTPSPQLRRWLIAAGAAAGGLAACVSQAGWQQRVEQAMQTPGENRFDRVARLRRKLRGGRRR